MATWVTPWVLKRYPSPWWKPWMARITAMPRVPTISTNTPNRATVPITWAPVMLRMVWISSSTTVTSRTVLWSEASRFQPNQLWVSDAT